MAFVTPSPLRLTTFTTASSHHRTSPLPTLAAVSRKRVITSCASAADDDSPAVGIAGKSAWKEDLFAGGFPGGEAYFQNWIDKGMTDDVPDMPQSMQPRAQFKPLVVEKTGILADLDKVEFFKSFIGTPQSAEAQAASSQDSPDSPDQPPQDNDDPDTPVTIKVGGAVATTTTTTTTTSTTPADPDATPGALDTEVPDESLYEQYFPKETRNLAPCFEFDVCDNPEFNRVGLSMLPIDASVGDLYYPDIYKNKAPFINIQYSGAVGTSSVSISVDQVDPLPSLPPPTRPGQVQTTLSPGSGGGLKLSFSVDGEPM